MTEWQPIKTAPRDGTEIIVWFDDHIGARVVSWCVPQNADFECWSVDDNKHGPFALRGYLHDPTHWMPLPDPPSPQTE